MRGRGPHAARAARRVHGRTGVRVPPGRRLDRRVRTAAQAAAGGHADVRLRARRGLDRGARPGVSRAAARDPGDGPYVLYGWSLGGVLAFAVANLLREEGADVRIVGLIDVAMPADPAEESPAGVRARWERYAEFAKRTYGVDAPLPYDRLVEADEAEQIQIIMDLVKLSGAKIPGGVIEHQRTSWIDTRELLNASSRPYDGDVVLYLADRYHADAIDAGTAVRQTRAQRCRLGRRRAEPRGHRGRGRPPADHRRAATSPRSGRT